MKKMWTMLCLATILAGCTTPRDLRGTWRLDVEKSKEYYASVNWPHPIDEEWWQGVARLRRRFSRGNIIDFTPGSRISPRSLGVTFTEFSVVSSSNGTYHLDCTRHCGDQQHEYDAIFTVDHDRLEEVQPLATTGVVVKLFYEKE
jgi:hypothetical protein